MKRIIIASILALAILGAVAGLVYAFARYAIPTHIDIVEPAPNPLIELEFYEDEDCTVPCEFFEWGQVAQGETVAPVLFYIKNVGKLDAYVTGTHNGPYQMGDLDIKFTVQPSTFHSWAILNPGDVARVRAWLDVAEDAPLGDLDFDIIIKAEEY